MKKELINRLLPLIDPVKPSELRIQIGALVATPFRTPELLELIQENLDKAHGCIPQVRGGILLRDPELIREHGSQVIAANAATAIVCLVFDNIIEGTNLATQVLLTSHVVNAANAGVNTTDELLDVFNGAKKAEAAWLKGVTS